MDDSVPGIAATVKASLWTELEAPAGWLNVDFISDLHLQASQLDTFVAWQKFMQTTPANAVFILGDLFDVWVGDDVVNLTGKGPVLNTSEKLAFEERCAHVLQSASRRLDIFFMHGNRDFLLGPAFAKRYGLTLLPDPSILNFAGYRWLLSHGDALCTGDAEYMGFREKVRNPSWQLDFLGKTLTERQSIGRELRRQSEARKHDRIGYIDVDEKAACAWLDTAQADALIHGHTHKPDDHLLVNGLRRHVLSDWDASAAPPRTEVFRVTAPSKNQAHNPSIQRVSF